MNLGQLRGVIPALVTPFGADGSVDCPTLGRLAARMVEHGVHGIMSTGGTGEFPHLSDKERMRATRAIAGTGACTTDDALMLAAHAAEVGAAAIISVPPFYFPLSGQALADFFASLADGSSVPLFIYNDPRYTGSPLRPELLVELLQHPNIVGSSTAVLTSASW